MPHLPQRLPASLTQCELCCRRLPIFHEGGVLEPRGIQCAGRMKAAQHLILHHELSPMLARPRKTPLRTRMPQASGIRDSKGGAIGCLVIQDRPPRCCSHKVARRQVQDLLAALAEPGRMPRICRTQGAGGLAQALNLLHCIILQRPGFLCHLHRLGRARLRKLRCQNQKWASQDNFQKWF